MKKISIYIIAGLLALLFIKTGCKDLTNVTSDEFGLFIKSVIPAEGSYGKQVVIGGTGFGSERSDQKVLFNGTPAPIEALGDTVIHIRVPSEAQTGPISVIVNQDTAVGPVFTVIQFGITEISPESGPAGTEVTISGNGFSPTPSENIVTFDGVRAELLSASQTELLAVVPAEATTGPVNITVDGYTANGPDFTVQEAKTLEVAIETEGSQVDENGYTLSVTGKDNRFVKVNDNVQYSDIYDDEVQVELSDIAGNCRVVGENPRNVVLNNSDNAGFTSFALDCTYDLRGKIVFATDRDNYGELYKQNGDGSAVERITHSTDYYEAEPAISPDGLQIVFSNSKGGGKHILVMDSDGSDVKQITDSGYNSAPTWSPDGSRILFGRSPDSDSPSDLFIMNSDGSNLQNITNTETAREFRPDWSPDGNSIVYEQYIDGNYEIYTIDPDGTNKVQMTNNELPDFDPEWSPTGDRIAFVRKLPDAGRKVHIMNSDGTGVQELTLSKGNERSPSWSPDGSKVVFSKYLDGYTHIYIYSVEFDDLISSPYTSSNDRAPHWNYK